MDWQATWDDPLTSYLATCDSVLGDARTRTTVSEPGKGMLGAGALIGQRSAAHSPAVLCGGLAHDLGAE